MSKIGIKQTVKLPSSATHFLFNFKMRLMGSRSEDPICVDADAVDETLEEEAVPLESSPPSSLPTKHSNSASITSYDLIGMPFEEPVAA